MEGGRHFESSSFSRLCEFCRCSEREKGFSFKRCSQCLVAYYCSVECQTKDWELRHSRECKTLYSNLLHQQQTQPQPPQVPQPPRAQATPSTSQPASQSAVLSPHDLRNLAKNLNLSESWLTKCLRDESSLMNLKANDLRMILIYLRDSCNRRNARVCGNKSDMARSVIRELYGSNQAILPQSLPSVSTFNRVQTPTVATQRSPPAPPPAKRRRVGTETENGIGQPSFVGFPATGGNHNVGTDMLASDPMFLQRQNPYYHVQQQLLVIPFGAYGKIYNQRHVYRKSFFLDAMSFNELQEGKRQRKPTLAIHIRLVSATDKRDLGWDRTFSLTCNGLKVDLTRNEKKIRQLKLLNPFVTPYPADITAYVNQPVNNIIDFVVPRNLSGAAVVQLVRLQTSEQLIPNVRRLSVEASLAKTVAKGSGDIEETGVIVSLRCPLSYCKIQTPAKGTYCTHLQCFDAKSFLEYCNQQLLWHCPVCNKALPYNELLIDEYFEKMLNSVTSEEMKVMVLPDGTFSEPKAAPVIKREDAPVAPKNTKAKKVVEICLDDSDDDGGGGGGGGGGNHAQGNGDGENVEKGILPKREGNGYGDRGDEDDEEEEEAEIDEEEEEESSDGGGSLVGAGNNTDPIFSMFLHMTPCCYFFLKYLEKKMEEKKKEEASTPEEMKQQMEEECTRIEQAAREAKEKAEAMKAEASHFASLSRQLHSTLFPVPPPTETQSTELESAAPYDVKAI